MDHNVSYQNLNVYAYTSLGMFHISNNNKKKKGKEKEEEKR